MMQRFSETSRRSLAMLLAVSAAACSDHMPIEEARQAAAVDVGGAVLTGAQLEDLLMSAPQLPSREMAAAVISTFIDAAALRAAFESGLDLTDSSIVAGAVEPDARNGMLAEVFQARGLAMPTPTDAAVDSVARLGNARVFQQILFAAPPQVDSVVAVALAERARQVLGDIQSDADFSEMVRRHSDDSVSRSRDGFLPAATRNDIPPGNFGTAVWRLQPGEVSTIILSPVGLHIVRRATTEEARPGLRQWMIPVLAARADSIWVDSLSRARNVKVAEGVAARVRELAAEPITGGGDEPYASWDGGVLSARTVRMWLTMIPAGDRSTLTIAPDSTISLMLKEFANREAAYEVLVGTEPVAPRAWQELAPQFRDAVIGISAAYRDRLMSGAASEAVAGFMSGVTSGEIPYRPLPGALPMMLRDRVEIAVDRRAVEAVVLAAATEWDRIRADSVAAAFQ